MRNLRRSMELIRHHREAREEKGIDLLKFLQSEITHELSSPCFQNYESGSPGDFTLEWDAPNSQDIVLRKKCDRGEEVAVSALLGPVALDPVMDVTYPRAVDMKVCIKKPGLSSLLQFDCKVTNRFDGPKFDIYSASYLRSTSTTGAKYICKVPVFSELNSRLKDAFRDYLKSRGIGEGLMNFLVAHMHKKEENQYINWLQNIQKMVSKGE